MWKTPCSNGNKPTNIQNALRNLSIEHRMLIDLTFCDGYSYRKAAVLLGLPEGTVKAHIRAALNQLRASLRAISE